MEPAMYRKTKRDTAQAVSFGRLNELVNDGLDACYTAGGSTFSAVRKMQNMYRTFRDDWRESFYGSPPPQLLFNEMASFGTSFRP